MPADMAGFGAGFNPWGAVAGAAAGAVTGVANAALSDTPTSQTSPFENEFDSSGWNINFGGGSISSEATKTKTKNDPMQPVTSLLQNPYVLLALAAVVIVIVKKMQKG